MEEDDEIEMPIPKIVKYHGIINNFSIHNSRSFCVKFLLLLLKDYVEKLWGWDKLIPRGDSVSRSDYSNYVSQCC
jgi:hypothetical protein